MEIDRLRLRRRSLAYLLSFVVGVPFLRRLGQIVEPRTFDIREHISSHTSSQLRTMGLSDEMAELVINFQNDILARPFGNFEDLRGWLLDNINKEYNLQRLAVHQRCIVSHTELALLISHFPTGRTAL